MSTSGWPGACWTHTLRVQEILAKAFDQYCRDVGYDRAIPVIRQMLETHERNVYTIEKNGVRKLIYQSPWYQNGEFAGLVEISLEIPEQMPHFVRG